MLQPGPFFIASTLGVPGRSFSILAVVSVPDIHLASDAAHVFPRYAYGSPGGEQGELIERGEVGRRDNIADEALAAYRARYGDGATKDDIFAYVYGVLHSPEYRERYATDLAKMLPRIPDVAAAPAFRRFGEHGAVNAAWETVLRREAAGGQRDGRGPRACARDPAAGPPVEVVPRARGGRDRLRAAAVVGPAAAGRAALPRRREHGQLALLREVGRDRLYTILPILFECARLPAAPRRIQAAHGNGASRTRSIRIRNSAPRVATGWITIRVPEACGRCACWPFASLNARPGSGGGVSFAPRPATASDAVPPIPVTGLPDPAGRPVPIGVIPAGTVIPAVGPGCTSGAGGGSWPACF